MVRRFSIAYFAHAIRSDWNNGNAHFLRGLLRALIQCGHQISIFEPEDGWSIRNLCEEERGEGSLHQFAETYPELPVEAYSSTTIAPNHLREWREKLKDIDFVILHEWNPPALAQMLLAIRKELGFHILFHDTHHRASSSPEQIRCLGLKDFDGVLAFGEALRRIYREEFNILRVWTLHEAADTTVFRPVPNYRKAQDVIWIGNWGDDERSLEIHNFLLRPALCLRERSFAVYGVRYPQYALDELSSAGIAFRGYLPNLQTPMAYGSSRLTVHIPRQQYTGAMAGIPTIRIFEALACGIPMISAPWEDREHLFSAGDICFVFNGDEMRSAIEHLLADTRAAAQQAKQGLCTVLTRHTCHHRAEQLTSIFEEVCR